MSTLIKRGHALEGVVFLLTRVDYGARRQYPRPQPTVAPMSFLRLISYLLASAASSTNRLRKDVQMTLRTFQPTPS